MQARKILFDNRWVGHHGIGRFAREMQKSALLQSSSKFIGGDFSSIFSAGDPLKISISMREFQWYLSPSYNCPVWPASRSMITLHDLMHVRYPAYKSVRNHCYYHLLVRRVCRSAPVVFTVSEFSKAEICEWAGICPDKVVVVFNGVDERFHTEVEACTRDRPYVFYIGDRKPHKNLEGIFKAFACSGLANDIQLLLSGRMDPSLMAMARDLGIEDRLVFAGFIPEKELPAVYKGAVALFLPSFYEGFGLPLLEAMAVGTPVLTSRYTAMPEIAGDAALLVDPGSVSDMAEGMVKIVENQRLRSQLVDRGLKRAKQFSWHRSREIFDETLLSFL